jgi:4-amino-4-deoxy-L-arabinose transferase-like glycosyltransferase
LAIAALALLARLWVAVWAAPRFPAAGDGFYYDTLAHRLAAGQGYTWLWPDGAVTYAAHYPVGYPALLAAAYAILGARPIVAMVLNAVLGALGALAMHRLALRAAGGWRADAAALAVAGHPALLPYTAALMTEGVTASLLIVAAALAAAAKDARRHVAWLVAAGLVMGIATLVRPQCLLLAPVLGLLGARADGHVTAWSYVRTAVLVTAVSLAVCAPWTARNCVRMEQCALISVNGGWNLLIGEQTTTGGWTVVDVPPECREVWAEAAKNECFGRAARHAILAHPGGWLAKVPAKVASTFDYIGASPWYMHVSNGVAFDEHAKVVHGTVETVITRLWLLGALVACGRLAGPRRRARIVVALVGAIAAVTLHAWIGYVAVSAAVGLLGARALSRAPLLVPWTGALILATAATHAVFFGSGRYGLVVLPFVVALAFVGRVTPMPPDASASRSSSTS